MKIIGILVMSVDGKITKGEDSDIYKWTSSEDTAFFREQIAKNNLILMGSKTYEAIAHIVKPQEGRLRVVMTQDIARYNNEKIAGQLEFSDLTIDQLIVSLEARGYKQMLLVGGAHLFSSFLQKKKIHELLLTIEPRIFGYGTSIIDITPLDTHMKLLDIKKLNEDGTVLLHYKITQ